MCVRYCRILGSIGMADLDSCMRAQEECVARTPPRSCVQDTPRDQEYARALHTRYREIQEQLVDWQADKVQNAYLQLKDAVASGVLHRWRQVPDHVPGAWAPQPQRQRPSQAQDVPGSGGRPQQGQDSSALLDLTFDYCCELADECVVLLGW